MYVKHSVHVAQPVDAVSAALMEGPSKWFPELRDDKAAKVGLHIAGLPVRKNVEVDIGKPVKTASWAEVPISWKATGSERLFPVMNGKIEIAPVGKDETRLTVSGMYEAPLGKLGEQLDQAMMHTIAEGTVRELAESIAKKLSR
jgi:hypothetical protein